MALIKLLSDIFVPIIPALVAGGLLMALQNFLTAAGLFGPKSIEEMYPAIEGISSMIQLMSAAPFMFLPILVGISAAKRFWSQPVPWCCNWNDYDNTTTWWFYGILEYFWLSCLTN